MPIPLGPIIASAAPSIISGLFGNKSSGKREAQLRRDILPLQDLLKEYEMRGNQGYLQSSEAKSFLSELNNMSEDQRFQLSNLADIRGFTDEAELSGMDKINKNEAKGVNSLVGNATNFRQTNMNNRRRLMQDLFSMKRGGRAQNEAIVGANTQAIGQGLQGGLSEILAAFAKNGPTS